MYRLPSYRLWQGHAGDLRNVRSIHDADIAAVVDLALEEPVPTLTRDLMYCRVPLKDGAGNPTEKLHLALSITMTLIRQNIPTLVACSGGQSRSPTIISAALSQITRQPPQDILTSLFLDRPHDVSPGLWTDVVNLLRDVDSPNQPGSSSLLGR